ncbi:MAG TPA: family 10 glycosylhydrolase [bacterium]|nr:family 10 glycosylhydrolase [bacterium]
MKPGPLLLALLCLAAPRAAAAAPLLEDGTKASAWAGDAGASAPKRRHDEGHRYLRFSLADGSVSGTALAWQKQGHWDLAHTQRLALRLRAQDGPGAGQARLSLRAGQGWYALPAFGLSRTWKEVDLDRARASVQGSPFGWSQVDALRLELLPGAGPGAWVDLERMEAQSRLPDVWVWQVGGARSKEALFAMVMDQARGEAYVDARRRLSEADSILTKAKGRGLDGLDWDRALRRARAQVGQAWALAQRPVQGQALRAAWAEEGDGARAWGPARAARWKDALPEMAGQGINLFFPKLQWGGTAYYPSQWLAPAAGQAQDGDELQEILDAAKPVGVQVEVGVGLWQLGGDAQAPGGAAESFRLQGRLSANAQGREGASLCPCDERNRKAALDALVELATRYPIDGVQLDGLAFDGAQDGFGPACRARFEAAMGRPVAHWPQDCAPGGPLAGDYGDFKRQVISAFVRDAAAALRAVRPGLQISAVVEAYPQRAHAVAFQDWPAWLSAGWLDFVCPLPDAGGAPGLEAALSAEEAVAPAGKLLPGVVLPDGAGRGDGLDLLVADCQVAAAQGTRGIGLMEWRETLLDGVLPYLRNGLWRSGPYALALRTPPPGQSPPAVAAGKAPAAGPKSLLLDDFEGGDLRNKLGLTWTAEVDGMRTGSRLAALPLQALAEGAHGSRFGVELKGHVGPARPPWPWAALVMPFWPGQAPADLGAFRALSFMVRGDGRPVEVLFRRASVADGGDYRVAVPTQAGWTQARVNLLDLAQPAWAQAVDPGLRDVTALAFQPAGRDDEDFWFDLDDVRLER